LLAYRYASFLLTSQSRFNLTEAGITVTVSTFVAQPPYLFDTIESSSLRWAPIIGGLSGWTPLSLLYLPHIPTQKQKHQSNNTTGYAFGHWFNGWIYRSRQKTWYPEYRLLGAYFAIGTMACGLLTYGLTLHYQKHWAGLAFGWLMVVAGMIASTV
jgi:hypothetical protein